MKDESPEYIGQEEASVRKPVELYKIWRGDVYWYYTNSDAPVEFPEGTIYTPATLSRGSLEYNSTLDISTMKVQFAPIAEPIVQYIAQNPIDIIWIEISRLFRNMDPLEKSVIFIGQMKNVAFKGVSAEAECVGFEHFLKMPVPIFRYQLNCNHKVFDSRCQATIGADPVQVEVTLDTAQTQLTAAEFAGYDAGYFTGGLVQYAGESRSIVAHAGDTITIAYRMMGLTSGQVVDVYPGCDGRIETCRDKFDNIVHFLGFPFIPDENPALRVP